ncbi:hypothetical protein [Bradyrhizobium sp. ARR65]|uniref:hypothetical protein n=1 Tax=Bradyrhizobium sp. ARR65 TaxID=1040989 RepID=UPI000AF22E4E|nr:hypothetical protein [Bradyrhizobium sp. ARR65]
MFGLSIFAAAAVPSVLTATPVDLAKEHHRVRKAPQHINIVIPRWSYAALRPLVHHDASPIYDDPSKFGGPTALAVQ